MVDQIHTNRKIRWAIGSSDGPRSSSWSLWVNRKGDVYVAVRSLGGVIKVSFHRDGKCHFGFTKESKATTSSGSRHIQRWHLPIDQVVRALQIIIPHSELRSFRERNMKRLCWLPSPPANSVAVVSIFISPATIELSTVQIQGAATIFGKIITDIRTAWLIYGYIPRDNSLSDLIQNEHDKLKPVPGAELWPSNTRAALWEDRKDHNRHVLEIACI